MDASQGYEAHLLRRNSWSTYRVKPGPHRLYPKAEMSQLFLILMIVMSRGTAQNCTVVGKCANYHPLRLRVNCRYFARWLPQPTVHENVLCLSATICGISWHPVEKYVQRSEEDEDRSSLPSYIGDRESQLRMRTNSRRAMNNTI